MLGWYGDLISVTTPQAVCEATKRRMQYSTDRLVVAKGILRLKLESQTKIGKFATNALTASYSDIETATTLVN